MQGLLKKLFLITGIFTSASCLSQAVNTENGSPALNQAPPPPVIFNNNANGNTNIILEEKPAKIIVPAAKEEKALIKSDAVKKGFMTEESLPDSQMAVKARMQQQFRINQSNASRQYSRRSATVQEQAAMDESVMFFKIVEPESFESAYYSWLAGHYDVSRVADLRKAEKLQPENIEVIKQKAMYYTAANKKDSLNTVLKKLDTLGYYTEGQLMYAEDMLLSCETNSTLIVHGFDDYLAAAYMNAPDERVKVVSLDLMQSEDYRDLCAEDLAIPEQKEVNVEFLEKLCKSSAKPVNLSMTIPSNYFQPIKNSLYVQGLTFVYSEKPLDTYKQNDALWFRTMNKLLLTKLESDNFRIWTSNYKAMLTVLKNQLSAHKHELPAEDYESKLEDINNNLDYIIQKGR